MTYEEKLTSVPTEDGADRSLTRRERRPGVYGVVGP